MNRKVLLLEPNYRNKYPPMPLMKLATYYRRCGDDVRFFKGDLRRLAAKLLAEELFKEIGDKSFARYFDILVKYIYAGKYAVLEDIPDFLEQGYERMAHRYRLRYVHHNFPQFDIVAVTTLFTFYWKQTIDTINMAKYFVRRGRLLVGGIAATLVPQYIEKETGIIPHKGLLDKPGILDKGNTDIIDTLPMDYSILEEIEYRYPAHDAYFGYMTRGCIRNCPFCAVKTLEPTYKSFISIKKQLRETDKRFGTKRDLLLMDNNVFASQHFSEIINEIIDCGFSKGATYIPESEYDIAYRNIKAEYNLRGYLRKMLEIYGKIAKKLPESQAGDFYLAREKKELLYLPTATRENVLTFDEVARPLYEKYFHTRKRRRSLDFNQGIDARLVTEEKIQQLSRTAIRPLRIAFDHYEQKDVYIRAIEIAAKYGINYLSNYLLYNYKDKPEHLYERMRINVDLCEKLDVSIYSFPMKYHPIDDPRYFRNRDYIGEFWNRKFIRAVQAVLNATKGKIGRGVSFFEEAFGRNLDEFCQILWMPETFIIYRNKYKENLAQEWRHGFLELAPDKLYRIKRIIAHNDFSENVFNKVDDAEIREILTYYRICRKY